MRSKSRVLLGGFTKYEKKDNQVVRNVYSIVKLELFHFVTPPSDTLHFYFKLSHNHPTTCERVLGISPKRI